MIAKHSSEESKHGEGVEVVENCPIDDPDHGQGQYTEKKIHLSSRLPSWIRSMVPKIFYVTEKAWNYYPFTITEYTCSFIPRCTISIQTKYLNDKGTTENVILSGHSLTHWSKNPQFIQKLKVFKIHIFLNSHFSKNSHFQSLIFHKIHNFKI